MIITTLRIIATLEIIADLSIATPQPNISEIGVYQAEITATQ